MSIVPPDQAPRPLPDVVDVPTTPATRVRSVVRDLRAEFTRPAAEWPGAGHPAADAASPALAGRLADLRAVTTRYVCGLRTQGARPEQMLPRVKALVRDAMVAEGWHDPLSTAALVADVVRWSIDAYYDDAAR